MNQFDESYFDFSLTSGGKNTEIIKAEAIILKGPQKGKSLSLKCQWFNITKTNDFLEIDGVTGAVYQPSLEDVGTKYTNNYDRRIMVQAVPILDSQEYEGMPVFKETGFIVQDPLIQQTITNLLSKNEKLVINCRLEMTNLKEVQVPQDLLLTISEQDIEIFCEHNKQTLNYRISENHPSIKIQKRTSNGVYLILNEELNMHLILPNNISRDVLFLMIKTLRGKAKVNLQIDSSNNHPQQEAVSLNSELYAKVDDQALIIQNQQNEILTLKQQLQEARQQIKDFKAFSLNTKKTLDEAQSQTSTLQNDLSQKDKLIEKQSKKLIFYEQEINLIKTQLVQVENNNKKLISVQQEMMKSQEAEAEKIKDLIFKEKEDLLNKNIMNLKQDNANLRVNYDSLKIQLSGLQDSLDSVGLEKEMSQNEIQSLKKKIDSLASEQSALIKQKLKNIYTQFISSSFIPSHNSSPRSERSGPPKNYFGFQDEQLERDDEVKRFKQQINNLEQTIKSLRIAYDQDMRAKQDVRVKQNHGQSHQDIFLQKLANNLAETITEKDTALENSRLINKGLMKRISEMEMILQQVK